MFSVRHVKSDCASQSGENKTGRIQSLDALRGLAIVLMVLDHTRIFFSNSLVNPLDLGRSTAPLFLLRWITHPAGIAFFFLAGMGARLALRQRNDAPSLSRFLLLRGLLLLVLELSVMRLLWGMAPTTPVVILQALWALGWGMILLAALVRLPLWVAGIIAVLVLGTGLLLQAISGAGMPPLVGGLLVGSSAQFSAADLHIIVAWPLLVWGGIMAGGYTLTDLLLRNNTIIQKRILQGAVCCLLLFLVLRLAGIGDTQAPVDMGDGLFTVFSFLNVTKYPPSLSFLLLGAGLMLLLLYLLRHRCWLQRILAQFGRVPLFFYLAHLAVLQVVWQLVILFGYPGQQELFSLVPVRQVSTGFGLGPGWIVVLTIMLVAILYPVCRWYDSLRYGKRIAWLRYF